MAVTVTETANSRRLEGPGRFIWHYLAKGSNTIDDIATALVLATPFNYGFWIRMWDQKSITPLGGGVWECEVPYGVGDVPLVSIGSLPGGSSGGTTGGGTSGSSPPTVNDGDQLGREWSFDFSQATKKITKSLSTSGGWWGEFIAGTVIQHQIGAELHGDVVGYDFMNGEVNGAEIADGAQRMEIQFKVPVITMGYVKKLRKMFAPPHVNSEAFLGQAPLAVKTVGCNINWSSANGFTVRAQFDVGTHRVGVEISPDLPVTDIKAWQYVDVAYLPKPDANSPTGVSKQVVQYLIHNVYAEADLNDMFT